MTVRAKTTEVSVCMNGLISVMGFKGVSSRISGTHQSSFAGQALHQICCR